MAYTPTNWECGDTVTAEKLNNIERGVTEMNSEYTPTTWECGDLITAEKMNKIEQGIANAGGGGGGSTTLSTTADSGSGNFTDFYVYRTNDYDNAIFSGSISFAPSLSIPFVASNNDYEVLMLKDDSVILSITGDYETLTVDGTDFYKINGDITIKAAAWES